MAGPAYAGGEQMDHRKILKTRLERRGAAGDAAAEGASDGVLVGFVFRFAKLTQEQLDLADWRMSYIIAIRAVIAFSAGWHMLKPA
jgi:hypothetical protein